METSLFDHHLHLFSAHSPALAFRLKSCSHFKMPLDEKLALREHHLQGVDLLYLFGLPGPLALASIEPWLREDQQRYLVILVHDEAELTGWLRNAFVAALLTDPQIKVCHFDAYHAEEPLFQWLNLFFVALKPAIAAMPSYERDHADLYNTIQTRILRDATTSEQIVHEFLQMGDLFYANFFTNLFRLNSARPAHALFGKFRSIPAIICGAGPSLNKHLSLLKELTSKALVMGGGSALNALSYGAMLPHFGVATDPHLPQIERLMSQNGFEVPIFYRNRWNCSALAALHGPRLYLHGACGYPVASWIEDKLNISGEILDEGDNVIHECLSIAYKMGCDPIIFVGMDLAYTSGEPYAQGVNSESHWQALQTLRPADVPVKRESIDGSEVYTHWKWIEESSWITRFAKLHPDRTFINATEGGIGFEAIANSLLSQVANQYLQRSYPLTQRINAEMQNALPYSISAEKIADSIKELESSLKRCQTLLGELLDPSQPFGRVALLEIELDEEVAYQQLLSTLSFVQGSLHHRLQDQLQGDIDEHREAQLRRRIFLEKHQFLQQASETILQILQRSLAC